MKTYSSRLAVAVLILGSMGLTGCAPSVSTIGPNGGSPASHPGAGSGADCSVFDGQTDPAVSLFTTSAIISGPAQGQVIGDGSKFSITLSPEAVAANLLPQFEINYLSSTGGPLQVSSLNFDPTSGEGGVFSTELLQYGKDELVGKAVVAQVFAISHAEIDGVQQYGDKLLLGNFCMTYANDGS